MTRRAGFYRAGLVMRKLDAENAVRRVHALPWVDSDNLFLVGFSQGGIAAAMMDSRGDDTSVCESPLINRC